MQPVKFVQQLTGQPWVNVSPIFTSICLPMFFCCRSSSQLKPIELIDEQPIKHSDMVKNKPINTDNTFMLIFSFH